MTCAKLINEQKKIVWAWDIWLNCGFYLAARPHTSFIWLNPPKSYIAFPQEQDFFKTGFLYPLHHKTKCFCWGLLHHTNILQSYSRNVEIFHRFISTFLFPFCRWETKTWSYVLPCSDDTTTWGKEPAQSDHKYLEGGRQVYALLTAITSLYPSIANKGGWPLQRAGLCLSLTRLNYSLWSFPSTASWKTHILSALEGTEHFTLGAWGFHLEIVDMIILEIQEQSFTQQFNLILINCKASRFKCWNFNKTEYLKFWKQIQNFN